MAKIIVAYAAENRCAQVAQILQRAGIAVFGQCTSAGEVRRAMDRLDDGIVISGCRLPDGTVDELAWDLGEKALVLAMDSAQQLEQCSYPKLFKLSVPCARSELVSSVSMLIQLHHMRLPHRGESENRVVERAKEKLMRARRLSEPEAHRFLQRSAMNRGMKLADFAAICLAMDE